MTYMRLLHFIVLFAAAVLVGTGCGGDPTADSAATAMTEQGVGETTTSIAGNNVADAVSGDDTSADKSDEGSADIEDLWSYGLISVRTGEPIVFAGGEHMIDDDDVSYGYNLVVDIEGNTLDPAATPLKGGEQLVVSDEYQEDSNVREYARVVSIMAPIRDAILYNFEDMSREEWLEITEILTTNGIKTEGADVIDGRLALSTEQVYEYVASGEAEGSPVARYLEEAGLELKCLAFVDFDFTNPEGANHCEEHGINTGSGITLP